MSISYATCKNPTGGPARAAGGGGTAPEPRHRGIRKPGVIIIMIITINMILMIILVVISHILLIRGKQRDPNPKYNSLIRKQSSTSEGLHSTLAALCSSQGVVVRVRVPLFATQV